MRYFDTSVLIKLYIFEPRSAEAVTLVQKESPPLPLTHFHEIELRTAIRAKIQRKEIIASDMKQAFKNFEADITSGVLTRCVCDLEEVFYTAEIISNKYATTHPCRTLDILHIAAALVLKAKTFVTFDQRQGVIAKKCGLSAPAP